MRFLRALSVEMTLLEEDLAGGFGGAFLVLVPIKLELLTMMFTVICWTQVDTETVDREGEEIRGAGTEESEVKCR